MAEFIPNTLKTPTTTNKQETQQNKKPAPVVTATPKVKKKTLGQKFVQTFIAEDIKSVKEAVVRDVVIPKIKEIISNIINESVSRLFYGRPNQTSSQNKSTVYYNLSNGTSPTIQHVNRSVYRYDNLIFLSETDAENVLLKLKMEIQAFGSVSVGYYYDITDRDNEPTDYNYGWHNLNSAKIVSTSEGWELLLPKPVAL